jgi:hypothetical protein
LKKHKILVVLLIVSSLVYAQDVITQSKIRLDDGSDLHVLIIENIPGKYIKIKLPGNQESVIDYKNIVSIKQKGFVYHTKFILPKGFYMDGSFGLLFGRSSEFSSTRVGVGIGLTGNYRFYSYLSLGLGTEATALSVSEGSFVFPVYVRVRGNFVERRIAPIYILDAGWSFVGKRPDDNSLVEGGWFARPAIGLQINRFTVSVGYQIQNITTTTENSWWWGGGDQQVEERLMKNITISTSLRF